jgi:hypothetical protein
MRSLIFILWLSTLHCSAQQHSWRLGDDQPFSTPIAKVALAERVAILATLDPVFKRSNGQFTLEPDEIKEARRSLRVQHVTMEGKPFLFVQAWGGPLCGATGNGAIWILDENHHIILDSVANRLTFLSAMSNGLPSIFVFTHVSAWESHRYLYRFDGQQYREAGCASIDTGMIEAYTHPLVTQVPCKSWQ